MKPSGQPPRMPARPRSASPAERSVEFAAIQERLKREAAERRAKAEKRAAAKPQRPR
jgi:hypothetical protein